MKSEQPPRSAPTLRPRRQSGAGRGVDSGAFQEAVTAAGRDRVVQVLLVLTVFVTCLGVIFLVAPESIAVRQLTALIVSTAIVVAMMTLAFTAVQHWIAGDAHVELEAVSVHEEAASAPRDAMRAPAVYASAEPFEPVAPEASRAHAAYNRRQASALRGTRDAPLAVIVVKMLRPDPDTMDALSRASVWAPLELTPSPSTRQDERCFVTTDRELVRSPGAVLAHLAGGDTQVQQNLTVGVALTPDDGAFDQAQTRARDAAIMGGRGELIWHDNASKAIWAKGGLQAGELRDALRSGEVVTLFQPLFDTRDWQLIGAELLVRWEHPECGALTPSRFLPHFRSGPEIAVLTQEVFATACRKVGTWEGHFGGQFQVVINAGVADLCSTTTFGVVAHLLHHVGRGRVWVDVEIDELLAATEEERATLAAQGEVGLQILAASLTSTSQLAALEGLPVVGVKVDAMRLGQRGWRQLEELAEFANDQGYAVHAVRVEGHEDVQQIRRIPAVSFVQGFAMSEPVHEAAMDAIVRSESTGGRRGLEMV